MYKILLTLFFVGLLNAEVYDGIAIVVKDEAITLLDIKNEMKTSKVDAKQASDLLIRQKLEKIEIDERRISVSSTEVYDDIKQMAARNNMSISTLYDAIRDSNGLNSTELKEKIKQKLLSQKLYSAIAYSSVEEPSQREIKEYFEMNKEKYSHPSEFSVIIYESKDGARLQEKVSNPMIYAPDISMNEQVLAYDRVSPELAKLLQNTPLNSFTQVVPNGQGSFMSFYLKEIKSAGEGSIEGSKNEIINAIMAEKREQVLGDHFARLRHNTEINIIREVE
ncbi:peptidyl-prolyl cis-trans isomerase [Sulfurimonas aquatica]|uniref:Peptidyl-prolyl cis-trans isomerase n=1 Tax=Sulfurimonas aquatica TaxID=2672570 RepID=A0A975GBH8_9BACT|nr:peptidylprolyl isomerase [Sulfurimonas aquatica]QSZ40686.1 peptidyl-prolyl cis-trans isomerase [Sulfurimonas aquatica]